MQDDIDPIELQAFADGELSGERAERVRLCVERTPELARRVEDLRALDEQVREAFVSGTPAPSDALRASVESMGSGETSGSGVIGRIVRFAAIPAAAAVVLVGVLLYLQRPAPVAPVVERPVVTRVLDASLVEAVEAQHLYCSALEDHFAFHAFPRLEAELPGALEVFLTSASDVPDLSALGYTFAGGGPCVVPGGKTAHVLYRSPDGGEAISVFMQRDRGQLDIPEDETQVAAGPDAEHPMLVWRSGGTVYFLIGDSFGATSGAAESLGRSF